MEIVLKYFPSLSPIQQHRLEALKPLYQDWNARINIISRKDIDSLYEKHVLHSLAIAILFDFKRGTEIIDIGTGGGFPGIPLAIYFPEVKFLLVDSIGKKIKAVQEIARSLPLDNVTTHHGRVEEINNRKFQFAVSRAVAPIKELWKWSKPLLMHEKRVSKVDWNKITSPDPITRVSSPGLICLKGGDLKREVAESKLKLFDWEIQTLFNEPYFAEKHILYIPL